MRRPSVARRCVLAGVTAAVTAAVWTVPATVGAGAAPAVTVIGEGTDAITPVMVKLLHDDAAGLNPDFGNYAGSVGLEPGIADFVGTGKNAFGNDFTVTERPLTTAEAATATANGRSFAYVPFAATPVALMTLVPNSTWQSQTIISTDFCPHIQLSLTQLDGIYGAPSYTSWGDSNLNCTATPQTAADALPFVLSGNLDPTMENYALMSLIDSTPTSKAAFGAGLTAALKASRTSTSDPTASEHWPYSATAVSGGDAATVESLIGLNARTGAPNTQAAQLKLGAIMPVASDWTGAPLGVTWNLPTAAVQNATGAYVPPTSASAKAALAAANLASTTDPTTNNLVTFPASTDAAAYNNILMLENYLVVPTSGLSAEKALALAQFIRFAVGGTGQADITAMGAAPATPTMVTADLVVAQTLNAEAATAAATTPTSTTTTTTPASTTATTVASSTSGTGAASTGPDPNAASTNGSTSGGLAVTGDNPVPLLGLGLALLICGEGARQILRRRKARA